MKRHALWTIFVAALCVAGPLSAAAPFGHFGGKVGGGNAGGGVVPIHGWALDDDGVASVDILVDGYVVGRANYGRSRPSVAANFPGFPDSSAAGYAFQLNTTHFLNGNHVVSARVTSETGEVVDLDGLVFEFTNLTHNLVPFGAIERPNPDAELFGNCDVGPGEVPRYTPITGYAMDVGVETGDQGVGYVELLIDGAIYANSQTSCRFDTARGGLTDCYGMRRLDLATIFPNVPGVPLVGFRFVLDIGELLDFGYTPGRHTLTIRAGDISGQVANIDEINVTFSCDDFIANEGAFGRVGRPRNGLIYTGTIEATGWALDREGVAAVQIFVDGQLKGLANLGEARPGVTATYPGFIDSLAPGWSFDLDTTALSDGPHTMEVIVQDRGGEQTLIGEREFKVFNP